MNDHEDLLGPSEAARRIGISYMSVYRLLNEGKLDGVKTPLGWLVDPVSVDAYAEKRARRAAARATA